jgi:N-acyl-D-aspartate/D-glutamate deacylase
MGLTGKIHPFIAHRGYQAIMNLPLAERVARMRDPEVRRQMIAEEVHYPHPLLGLIAQSFHKLFVLGDPPCYEPAPEESVAAMAAREGRDPKEIAYDLMLRREGRELLYFPFLNYSHTNFEPIREMLLHPNSVFSLSDGGAHCGVICDAGTPTLLLTHWVRDRSRGARLPLEYVVHRQTRHTAALYGLEDRGLVAPGMRADLNVVDFDNLRMHAPEMVEDLPGAGRRLIQRADGYRVTTLAGQVTFRDGEPTGALPGRLVRGPQAAPAA